MESAGGGRRRFALFAAAGYALVLAFAAAHHVIWRDEARALSIAITPSSLGGLFSALKNEGHPALWYLLLRAAFGAAHTTAVLKAVSLLAAVCGFCLFARYSPYGKFEVLLWALGLLQLHEYSAVCRNYSLVLPLVFAYCALYPSRREHPWAAGLLLALLANTAAYGTVLALAFLGSEKWFWAFGQGRPRKGTKPFLLTAALALAGIAAAVWVMVPDRTAVATPLYLFHASSVLRQLGASVLSQGGMARDLFALPWGIPVSLVVAVWYFFLGKRFHLSFFVFASVVGCELLGRIVYAANLRHEGTVLVALVAAHWIATVERGPLAYDGAALRRGSALLARVVLVGILLIQARLGVSSAYADYRRPVSSSKELADFVLGRPDLRKAIILAEPDYMADALGYYMDNRIYVTREGRFARWTSFTTQNRPALSLGELLARARALRVQEKAPVLVVMGFDLGKPAMIRFSFGKLFWSDAEQLKEWNRDASLLRRFNGASGDENYALYRVDH